MKKLVVLASCFSLLLPYALPTVKASAATASTLEELKAEKIKSLTKREPRAQDLLNKAQEKIDKLKQSNADPALADRLQKVIDHIAFADSTLSEARIKVDVELLDALVKDHKEPGPDELAPLQERYKKLCALFEDNVFNKDLDRAFHIHDKLVRFTALGLYDKDKIASELERMEGLVERAADIPFGKAQLFDTTKNKKLASVNKLVYVGSSSHEEMYLTGDRRSVAIIDEGCGQPLNMELSEHVIQAADGKFINLNECNDPALGLPFSPPLSLWAKTRIQEGRVPAIQLQLVDKRVKTENLQYAKAKGKNDFITVADVATGKLDDYLKSNLQYIGPEKSPVLLGLFSEFDREAAATAFGADGHTPFYTILDPKLKDLPDGKRDEELKKRSEKGAFVGAKANVPELCNQYGDPAIPDGPERVKDSWKRLRKIVSESGSSSVSLFSSAGSFHGNKNAGKFEGEEDAGNQAWNKLEFYWPGEAVLDWVGINGIGSEPAGNPKGANLMEALESFMAETRSSLWQTTPVMLVNLAPGRSKSPLGEAAWISTVFTKMIPETFPNILAVYIKIPDDLTLWNSEAKSAFRTYISGNQFYNYKLRFKALDAPSGAAK